MTLTQNDLEEIENIVDEKITERTRNLPTKDEFFSETDKLMKEIKAGREEQTTIAHQVSDHEDRIATLETKVSPA